MNGYRIGNALLTAAVVGMLAGMGEACLLIAREGATGLAIVLGLLITAATGWIALSELKRIWSTPTTNRRRAG